MEIGRYSLGVVGLDVLGRGMTEAFFHNAGKTLHVSEKLMIWVITGAMSSSTGRIMSKDNLSQPIALVDKEQTSFLTISSVTVFNTKGMQSGGTT